MYAGLPAEDAVRSAIALAIRAPSILNSQPWQWRLGGNSLHLFADPSRHLPATDPDRRDLLMSCGAALHHLCVAAAALGWATTVHRLPNPAEPNHLAALEFHPQPFGAEDVALAAAIPHRRTDRRRFSSWPVPPVLLMELAATASDQGALLVAVTGADERFRLVSAMSEAALRQDDVPAYARELAAWSGRSGNAVEGVPAANVPAAHGRYSGATTQGATRYGDITMRMFDRGELAQTPQGDEEDAAELLVLATSSDERVSQLRAGEALSAVLLAATNAKLATCPLSQPLEIGRTREILRDRVLDGAAYPQIVLRVGWAPLSNPPVPASPRREIDDVLRPLAD